MNHFEPQSPQKAICHNIRCQNNRESLNNLLTELVLPDALDVREGVLRGRDEPRAPLPHLPLELELVVERPVAGGAVDGQFGGDAYHRRIAVL